MTVKYTSRGLLDLYRRSRLANGTKHSSKEGYGSDATGADPQAQCPRRNVDIASAWNMRKVHAFNRRRYRHSWREGYKFGQMLYRFILSVASETTHKDRVVLFGRDLFFATAVLDVLQHKLRGKWIYAEGVSREVKDNIRLQKWLIREITGTANNGRVFGLDTGWTGSVPFGALYHYERKGKLVIRLMSSADKGRLSKAGTFNREMMERFEHVPKFFLRCTQVHPSGEPLLRYGRPQDAEKALAFWRGVRAWTKARVKKHWKLDWALAAKAIPLQSYVDLSESFPDDPPPEKKKEGEEYW